MSQRPDRAAEITQFLNNIGWSDAKRDFLAGDASFRRYERVEHNGKIGVLMDAPPPWEDVRPFIAVTNMLRAMMLNAPRIDAADEVQGFLLLEDFGDASFTRVLAQSPTQELSLYEAAIDALSALQLACQTSALSLAIAPYDDAVYMREVALFSDWFLPQIVGLEKASELRDEYLAIWQTLLSNSQLQQTVLVHRDYHADNLLWLPQREGVARVGMLDYQDALLGDPFYDLVSLLEDARRDVSPSVQESCFTRFCAQVGEYNIDAARARYCLLGAQRNMKIIGIFTRLCVRDGKAHYLDYLPRVWAHLLRDITHPSLAPLAQFVEAYVPHSARGVFAPDMTIGALS